MSENELECEKFVTDGHFIIKLLKFEGLSKYQCLMVTDISMSDANVMGSLSDLW